MKNSKKILVQGAAAMPIGVTVGIIIALFFDLLYKLPDFYPSSPRFTSHFPSLTVATLVAAVLWALMGFVFGATAIIFDQEKWSITKQTVIHFLVTFICFTALAILAGWFPLNAEWLTFYTIIFIIIYVIMWSISMKSAKRKIAKINQAIQASKK
ncbi:DUF3021 domain-containing protein [Lactobacillus sp. ESL0791]|uniref:DUF3021 domain-containing protein n=1 Tax=Lactobacillus sp. ESL0791 TaxID=2983234 RepID=UPI0023F7C58D|nr:DUF3021 domain-containing protein [Lactobacillus sp. ESL0791]MDF7638087.1 DUF3021 domain-containing protein [Lactobacillus sp. ESL0791]